MPDTSILVPEIRELLEAGEKERLKEIFADFHPFDIAELLTGLETAEIAQVISILGVPQGVKVFEYFPVELEQEILGFLGKKKVGQLIEEMAPDERVDLVKALPEEIVEDLLPLIAQAERNDIRRLIAYQEGTAGSVMTTDYVALPASMTVAEALQRVRTVAPDKDTLYYLYIIEDSRRLIGFLSLKDLILARPTATLECIMHRDVVNTSVSDDVEVVARKVADYNLLAIPVTDENGRLVGIVTHDDAMEIVEEEDTEDIQKFMGFTGQPESLSYLHVPVWTQFKRRVIWVIGLAALGLLSGAIIRRFEDVLSNLLILALYMPMLADTGGNTGSQSATMVIRALALGQISFRDFFHIIFK